MDWWEIVLIFLLSTVKFVFGAVPMALAAGFSFFEAVTVTSIGGITGVTIFVFMSEKIVERLKKRKLEKQHNKQEAPKKKFTKKNKIIVWVKMRFGLIGIAFLTPLLLSIPIGCFLAVRYFKNKHRILVFMFLSILFWSVSVSSFKLLYNASI
ncbi:MAG: hypothetical protein K0Q95_71 [Bacteroidota bacterium]|jgi:uncharacterized membrane protein|nr:hypothetical protein [Bacteroidota bacterium]